MSIHVSHLLVSDNHSSWIKKITNISKNYKYILTYVTYMHRYIYQLSMTTFSVQTSMQVLNEKFNIADISSWWAIIVASWPILSLSTHIIHSFQDSSYQFRIGFPANLSLLTAVLEITQNINIHLNVSKGNSIWEQAILTCITIYTRIHILI